MLTLSAIVVGSPNPGLDISMETTRWPSPSTGHRGTFTHPCGHYHRSARDVLGQRGRGVILCHLEKRTDLRTRVAHSSVCTLSHIRVHRRLVQPYPPPFNTEVRQSRSV